MTEPDSDDLTPAFEALVETEFAPRVSHLEAENLALEDHVRTLTREKEEALQDAGRWRAAAMEAREICAELRARLEGVGK